MTPPGPDATCDVLVIGAGPAGLAAAETAADAGATVAVYEQMPTIGRKFLMAGKSGLNLTFDAPLDAFTARYGAGGPELAPMLAAFGPEAVRAWAEGLGQQTFIGSGGRVFPHAMKASPLLRAWRARLEAAGVRIQTRRRWRDWRRGARWEVGFDRLGPAAAAGDASETVLTDSVVLALGGASWARLGSDGAWAARFPDAVSPFEPSNVGVEIAWSPVFRDRFAGTALKGVRFTVGDAKTGTKTSAESRGEAVVSRTGLEGGGIYALSPALRAALRGQAPRLTIDLAPDRPEAALAAALAAQPPKRSASEKLRRAARLDPLKLALFREIERGPIDPPTTARALKALALPVVGLRPMDEAISSAGGLRWDAIDGDLMLQAHPGAFCAGEMLDWDAPTGGYLLTACLATGRWAGAAAAKWASARRAEP